MTAPARRGGAAAGFTLVELLVALALMALLTAVLFGGLRFGLRAWEVGGGRMEASDRRQQAQELLRGLLAEARPPVAGGALAPAFEGAPERLAFVAPLPAHRGPGGLYRFTLSVVAGQGGGRLVLAWQPYDGDARAGAPADRAVLLERVAALRLDFFGAAGPAAPRRWQARWAVPDRLPELVRLRLERGAGEPAGGWPDLVVAPRQAR
jgi:general secretion pathway protein J